MRAAIFSTCLSLACATESHRVELTWLGGPTVAIEIGQTLIMTDPMLGPVGPNAFVLPQHPSTGAADAPIDRIVEPPEVDLSRVKVVLISHGHADHFDATARAKLPRSITMVCPEGMVESMRAAGFEHVIGLGWGAEATLRAGEVVMHVKAIEAHHAHDAALDTRLGVVNGYWFSLEEGPLYKTVYWSGDTVSTASVHFEKPVDLALIHLGAVGVDGTVGRRSMNAEEGLALVKQLAPAVAVPIHHSTFGHYREDIAVFARGAFAENLPVRVMREGQSLVLP